MRTRLILAFIATVIFSSCSPYSSSYYQLFETQSEETKVNENNMIFENEHIKVIYNFWGDYGNSSFLIFNKTDSNIFIDLSKSHLVINDIAKTYFQNRTFTESSSRSFSVADFGSTSYLVENSKSNGSAYYTTGYGIANSHTNTIATHNIASSSSKESVAKGYSVSYVEKRIVCIPSNTAKIIEGLNINSTLYRDCYLYRFPKQKVILTKEFDKETSPIIIKNIITYGFNEFDFSKPEIVENIFWVSEITNYPNQFFFTAKYDTNCEQRSQFPVTFYLFDNPNNFYIKYYKSPSNEFVH